VTTHITRMAVGWEMGTRTGIGSGSTGEWGNSSAGAVTQVVDAARSGSYGLRINPSAASAKQSREFNLSQVFVLRFYFRYPTLPSADSHIFYIGAGGGAETNGFQLRFINSDDTVRFVELDNTGAVIETATGPVIVAGQWYRVDVLFRGSGAAGTDGLEWQIAEDDDPGVAQTSLTGSYAVNSIFFGSNTAQTFDLYVDDLYAAYSTDDGGEGGAALAAEYPRGPGYCRAIRLTGTPVTDAVFSTTDGSALADSHTIINQDPLIGTPGVRQDSVDTAKFMEWTVGGTAIEEWIDRYETGGEWVTSAGTPTIVGSPVLNGSNALELTPPVERVGYTFGLGTGVRVATRRVGFRFNTVPSVANATPVLAEWRGGTGVLLRFNRNTQKFNLISGATSIDFGPTVAANTWYIIEVFRDSRVNPWSCTARVKVDGGDWDASTASMNPAVAAADITEFWLGSNSAGDSYTAYYDDFGIPALDTSLAENEEPYAISVIAEARAVGGGASNATLKVTKDAAEQTVTAGNWNNGPQLISVTYLPGDSQTTRWTKAQVDAMTLRWGYSSDVTNPPIIGGSVITVDISAVAEPAGWPDAYIDMIAV